MKDKETAKIAGKIVTKKTRVSGIARTVNSRITPAGKTLSTRTRTKEAVRRAAEGSTNIGKITIGDMTGENFSRIQGMINEEIRQRTAALEDFDLNRESAELRVAELEETLAQARAIYGIYEVIAGRQGGKSATSMGREIEVVSETTGPACDIVLKGWQI